MLKKRDGILLVILLVDYWELLQFMNLNLWINFKLIGGKMMKKIHIEIYLKKHQNILLLFMNKL